MPTHTELFRQKMRELDKPAGLPEKDRWLSGVPASIRLAWALTSFGALLGTAAFVAVLVYVIPH